MSAKVQEYDVIIVGGGPVGLALGASLVRFCDGLSVAICDRRPFAVPNDARASALAAGVTRVFEALGLWDEMAKTASPVNKMKITDSGSRDISRPLFLAFEGDVVPGRPYAHLVPNKTTIGALLEAVQDKVDLIAPIEIEAYEADNRSAKLRCADGRVLEAPLVIAADGARSALRGMAGIETIGHDYDQMGIVTTITHELDHENTAFEHFRPAGPFASLPLPGKQSSLVWTERTADAQRLKELPTKELEPLIEQAMGSALGKVTIKEQVQAFPLRLQISREFIAPRLALVGDAAHVVHPIAGQGLNLGIKDVAVLAEIVIEAVRLGQDHGGADVLENYQRLRRLDTALMALATDGLNKLFSNDIAPLRALRDIGLGMVDRMPPIKTGLIRHAASVTNGPRLMQGQAI